ncbi:hypothetical protein KL906_000401 [Ogataea polymorpha]|nr:hypothetical protein KL906_000401 [Ogataea polymorpha]
MLHEMGECASNRLGTILKHASIKAEGGATAFGSQKGKVASEFSGKPQPSFFSRISICSFSVGGSVTYRKRRKFSVYCWRTIIPAVQISSVCCPK